MPDRINIGPNNPVVPSHAAAAGPATSSTSPKDSSETPASAKSVPQRTAPSKKWGKVLLVVILEFLLAFVSFQVGTCFPHKKTPPSHGVLTTSKDRGDKAATKPAKAALSDSSVVEKTALLNARAQAFTGALQELESDSSDYLEVVTSDPDEDLYNLPPIAWAQFIRLGNKNGQNWHFGAVFGPAERQVVVCWWVRKQFEAGATADSLALDWLSAVKQLDPTDNESQNYRFGVVDRYHRRLGAIISSSEFDELKSSARNTLKTSDRKSGIAWAIAWLIILGLILFVPMSIFANYNMGLWSIFLALAAGSGIGILASLWGILPLLRYWGWLGTTGPAAITLSCAVLAAGLVALSLKPKK